MNTQQAVTAYFQSETTATNYLAARLAGDIAKAPPNISTYQSEEHLADILFSVYCQNNFSNEQKTWFWNILNQQAKTAWQNKNAEIFGRSIYLYTRLGEKEAKLFGWTNFIDANIIEWSELMDNNDLDLYGSALWLLSDWHIPIDWPKQFSSIVVLLKHNEKFIRPFNHIFYAIEFPESKQWRQLIVECDVSDRLRELLQQCLLTSWGVSYKNQQLSPLLVKNVKDAFCEAKATKRVNKKTLKIFESWLKLEWPTQPKKDVKNLIMKSKQPSMSPMQFSASHQ